MTVGLGAGAVSTNTAVGASALATNSTGPQTVAIGYQAGNLSTAGYSTFIGYQAGVNQSTGDSNTYVGRGITSNASSGATTGSLNTIVGNYAFGADTSGSYNTAIGAAALQANTTASNNTAVGYQAGYATTSGYGNVLLGYQAGNSITSGAQNICIGVTSGKNITTNNNNMYIGNGTTASSTSPSFEIVIATTGATGKGGYTGLIDPNGSLYQGSNSSTWSVISDQRLKKNIVDNNVGLEKITQIQIRNFEYRTKDEVNDLPKDQAVKKEGVQLGVIAQELQQILPDCIKEESTGVLSVNSENITWHLINAIKELSAEVNALKTKVGI